MEFFKQNIVPGEVIVQLLAFLAVFFFLKAFAWKPILAMLEERRNRIKQSFDDIETTRKQVEELKHDYQEHLQKMEEEARQKLQEAVHEGERISRELQEKARTDAQAIFSKSKEHLQLEITQAQKTLREEIANLSVLVSEKIIREQMSDAMLQKKALEVIEELEKSS